MPEAVPGTDPAVPLTLAEVNRLIGFGQLDVATGLVLAALARRTGDEEAAAAAAVISAQQAMLAGFQPLRDAPRRLPRPSERGAEAFAELLNLLRMQDAQLSELQALVAEVS